MMKDLKKQKIGHACLACAGIVFCVSQLSACGEFAYKRGGNATELQQVRGICQTQSNDQKQIEGCLSEHGWAIQHLNTADPDPVIESSYSPDNRNISKTTPESKETTHLKPSLPLNSANQQIQESANPEKLDNTKQPTDIFNINSWWKLGNNSTLNADIQQCVGELGPEHQPDKELHHATRALLKCMNTKGWKALREK